MILPEVGSDAAFAETKIASTLGIATIVLQ
jgi:hypothetical protein